MQTPKDVELLYYRMPWTGHNIQVALLCLALCHGWAFSTRAASDTSAPDASPANTLQEPFRGLRAVRRLSNTAAAQRHKIQFEATVYFVSKRTGCFFVGDDTANYVSCQQASSTPVRLGDRVSITGETAAGKNLPMIVAQEINVLAQHGASALAEPTNVDFSSANTSKTAFSTSDADSLEYCWVQSKAVVETVSVGMGRTRLNCRSGEMRFEVSISGILPYEHAVEYVGSEIQFTGNLIFESRNGNESFPVIFTDQQSVTMKTRGKSLQYRPIDSVTSLWNAPNATSFHLRGQITYAKSTGFFLRTAQAATWIHNDLNMDVVVGDYLDVYGVRTPAKDLRIRMVAGGNAERLPQPTLTSVKHLLGADRYGRRARIKGKVQEITEVKEGLDDDCRLTLATDGFNMAVYMRRSLAEQLYLRTSQQISLTGTVDTYNKDSFDLAVFTPNLDDISVISRKAANQNAWLWLIAISSSVAVLIGFTVLSRLRTRAKQETHGLNQLLQSSYSSVRDGIIVLDSQHRITQFNERAIEILGVTLETGETSADDLRGILGKSATNAKFLTIWKQFNRETSDTVDSVVELDAPNSDTVRTLEVRSSPVRTVGDEYGDRLWTFHDITDQERLYHSLTHAQKQHTVGRMASGFAHDCNNLLTGIICNLTLAATDPNKSVGDVVGCLETAVGASRRASTLVSLIVNYSRKRDTNLQLTEVGPFIHQLLSLLEPTVPSNIMMDHFVSPTTPCVRIDENQIEQVLLNISLNAFDAMLPGGQVTIRTFLDRRVVDENHTKEYAVISIHDTGEGMSQETLKRIFEPFFTTKAESGSGLGLSMTKEIVRQHGGFIECDSVEDVGSEFRIYLPAASAELPASDHSQVHAPQASPINGPRRRSINATGGQLPGGKIPGAEISGT